MMMTPRALVLLVAFGLVACESTFPQDLETFCKVVQDVDKSTTLSATEKLTRIDARRGEYARYGLLETRDVWAESAAQQGQDKYRYLVAAGRNLGAREWRCPAYATLLNMAEVEALGAVPQAPSEAVAASALMRAEPQEEPEAAVPTKAKKKRSRHKRHRKHGH